MNALYLAAVLLAAQPTTKPLTYSEGIKRAQSENKPLVVFVGDFLPIKGQTDRLNDVVWCKAPALDGYVNGSIVVSRSQDKQLCWVKTLSPVSTSKDILDATNLPVPLFQQQGASQTATPFVPPSAQPDDNELARSLRAANPAIANYIDTLTPYRSATMTQQTFRRWSGFIGPFPRLQLEAKWRMPGHLEGVNGWKSRLFKSEHRPKVFLARQEPYDNDAAVTWFRQYPDGATFADVLCNSDGVVFEVRMAEKVNGRWERFIAYKDATARPANYTPPTRAACAECHRQAGISAYGGAAIPGGDEVLSDPYDDLENGRIVQGGYGTQL